MMVSGTGPLTSELHTETRIPRPLHQKIRLGSLRCSHSLFLFSWFNWTDTLSFCREELAFC